MICEINVNFGEKSQLRFFFTAEKELNFRYFGIYLISNNEKYIANCRIEAAIRRRYMSGRLNASHRNANAYLQCLTFVCKSNSFDT